MMKILFLVFSLLLSASSFCQHGQLNLSDDFKISENDDYKDQTVANSVFHDNFFYTATNSGIGSHYKWLFTKLYDMKYAITLAKFDRSMKKISDLPWKMEARYLAPFSLDFC